MFEFLTNAVSSAQSLWNRQVAPPAPPPAPAEVSPLSPVAPPVPDVAGARPVDRAAMSRAAADIFAACDGIGTDEDRIHRALRGKSPAEIAAIREEYRNHYGGNLDALLEEELDDEDLEAARAALSADPVAAAAATLVNAASGLGTDEDAIKDTLRGITDPDMRARVAAEYERRTGESLSSMLESELSGTDGEVANALAAGNTDEADALLLEDAMWGPGTDEEAINKVFERCTDQAQRDRVMAAYQARFGRSLRDDMSEEMEGNDLALANAVADGNVADAAAIRIAAAADGLGTDEDAIFEQLKVANPEARRAIIATYNARFGARVGGQDLDAMLKDELGDMDLERANQLAANGRLDPVFAMRYAMEGVGTDEDMMREALRGLNPEQAAQVRRDYRAKYGVDLEDEMKSELSGRDEHYITQSLGGEVGLSLDEKLRRADAAYDFERGSGAGIFSGFTDVFYDAGEQLDTTHDRLTALRERLAKAPTPAAREATEAEINRILGYQDQDQEAYHAAQDAVANGAATAAAVVATVAVTAATGGLGAGAAVPALASFMSSAAAATGIGATSLAMASGAVAGGLLSMGVKRSIAGEAYGAEAAGFDLAMTGVNALSAGAMVSAPLVRGLPQLLAAGGAGPVGSFGNILGTQVGQGLFQGAITGTASGLLDERTWRGPGNGFANFATALGTGLVSNAAGGVAQTLAGGAVGRQGLDLFDPFSVRGSFATGAIGGASGAFAQQAFNAGAFDGRWEDVLGRFGSTMAVGGIQGGLMEAGQTVSARRLAAGMLGPDTNGAPPKNPADSIPPEVQEGLPPEVKDVVQAAKDSPDSVRPAQDGTGPAKAELDELVPGLGDKVEAVRPAVEVGTQQEAGALTPRDAFELARQANEGSTKASDQLSTKIPELLEAQILARQGADPLLQERRSAFELALAVAPEAEAAAKPVLDQMSQKALDYITRTRGTPEAIDATLKTLGNLPESGLAGAVGMNADTIRAVLEGGSLRERTLVLADFQKLLGQEALAKGGLDNMRQVFGGDQGPVAPDGPARFGMDDIARLAELVESLEARVADPKKRNAKALFGPGVEGHEGFTAAKGEDMDTKLPPLRREAVAELMGQPVAATDQVTGLTGKGEASPLTRSHKTVREAIAEGITFSPREIAALGGLDGVLPWNQGTIANILDPDSDFVTAARNQSMPLKAGVSGTTYRFMHGANVLGADPAIARLICMAQLIPIDAHSFHEIAFAAQGFQGPTSTYDPSLPYTPASTGYSPEVLQRIAQELGLTVDELNAGGPREASPSGGRSEAEPPNR